MSEQDHTPFDIDEGYPANTVIGVIDDPRATEEVVTDLVEMPINADSIDIVCDEVAQERLQQYQEDHPWKARILHVFRLVSNESQMLERYEQALRQDRFLIRVPVEDEEHAEQVAKVMQQHGGYFINYLGPFAITTLAP